MATGVSFTNFTEAKVLNAVLRNTAFTPPAALYAALFTASPTDAGGGTECGYAGYARQATASWGAPVAGSPSSSTSTHTAALTFAAPAGNQSITAVGLYDASSGGNLWAYVVYSSPIVLLAGQPGTVAASSMLFTVD